MPALDAAHLRQTLSELGVPLSATVVVGVSGGVDSVVLLRLLYEAGLPVTPCHVNYGLRGAESEGDEAFVRALANELGLTLSVRRIGLPEAGNRQEAARDARYAFFRETAEAKGALAIAVGHHRDDQAETVLLNLFRGAGPHGLSGMPALRPIAPDSPVRLVRPLLRWGRADIASLAQERGWAWREDISNESASYARNRLRNFVMPLIQQEFGEHASRNIAEAADRVRALVDLADGNASSRLIIGELRALPKAQRHARYISALKRFAPLTPRRAEALPELDALLDGQPGRRVVWPGVTIWRERDALVIEPEEQAFAPQTWLAQIGAPTETPFGTLTIKRIATVPTEFDAKSSCFEVADEGSMAEPLHLRIWRNGDRFRPIGFDGTKLVSDVLTDRKVPPSERDRQLVLCSGDEIRWVVGQRLADAVRVRSATKKAVRLVWTPKPAPGQPLNTEQ